MKNKMTEAEYMELRDTSSGICTKCGEIRHGDTEPDAEDYPCENCGENAVQGIENAMIEGNIEIVEEHEKMDEAL